jgi:hypothetical protein
MQRGNKRKTKMMSHNAVDPSSDLAAAILAFDEDNPGDPDSEVVVPFEVWAAWVDLAGKIEAEE